MYKLLTNAHKWQNENKSEHKNVFKKHYNYYHPEKSLRTNMF